MVNTAFSPTDRTAGGTLSGGNLVFAQTANTGIRTTGRWSSGKYYFEYTLTVNGGAQRVVGVANAAAVLSSVATTLIACCGVIGNTGNIFINGNSTGISFGVRATGDVVCVAADFTNKLIWFRIGAAGNWNNNAGNNPATGVGGISIASLMPDSIMSSVYGLTACSVATATTTANFGDSAFTGAVPAGFTSGLPDNTATTFAAVTQAAAEHWAVPNPSVWLTQAALEQWVTTSSVGVRALATQVALEQWARVPLVATGRPRRVQNVVRR
jgi:phage tail protein X